MAGAIPPLPQYVFLAWCLVNDFNFYLSFLLVFDNLHFVADHSNIVFDAVVRLVDTVS
jgi:hypothetical protein